MKKQFLALMAIAVAGLVSCNNNNPDVPDDPKPSCVEEMYCATTGGTISYFTSPVTKNTFVCSWSVEGHDYIPYLQKVSSNGQLLWSDWARVHKESGVNHINETLHFAITPNDETIQIFNVTKAFDGTQAESVPFISKLSADGERMWGENGIEFYKFQEINPYEPIEGYAISDNKGGAWIAAANGRKEMVVRHVDGDGNLGKVYAFQPVSREGMRRPQLVMAPNGNVMIITENFDIVSHSQGAEMVYAADIRLSIIKPDGTLVDKGALIENKTVFPGNLPDVCPAADGFYVMLRAANNDTKKSHIIARRVAWDGTPLMGAVDVTPNGMDADDFERACVDKDNNLVVLCLGTQGPVTGQYGVITMNVVTPNGSLKFGDKGKQVYKTTTEYMVHDFGTNLLQKNDGTFFFTYSQSTTSAPFTYSLWGMVVDSEGNLQSNQSLLPIESMQYIGSSRRNVAPYYDGVLRTFNIDDSNELLIGFKFVVE